MRFCDKHWGMLRKAIDVRALTPLVARSGGEAAERAVDELEKTATDATFDPLMSCHWMVCNFAVENLGLYLMGGDYCPICECLRVHPKPCPRGCTDEDLEREMIDGPANAALKHVKASAVLCAILGWELSV